MDLKKSWSLIALSAACGFAASAHSRGVSPYLPLNLAPGIERDISQVMLLAGKSNLRRPLAAAVVQDALSVACVKDAVLCDRVTSYLASYMADAGITQLTLSAAIGDSASAAALPNQHGMPATSNWNVAGIGYYQPSDYLLLGVGGVGYQDNFTPTGTMLSAGFDIAQLDIGYRDHWWSPMSDSSMLISTQAPTMPSITLSNYRLLTQFGFGYEVFLAQMSRQENISYFDATTSGSPKLTGIHLSLEPAVGYSLGVNRLIQYGGGARGGQGVSGFLDALLKNSNQPDVTNQSEEFGNSVASITSSTVFPAAIPFAINFEYAGEDNAYKGPYRLGDTAVSIGLEFPKLGRSFDATVEVSEWQNGWYIHHLYPDGLTNKDRVIGHWFGDQRQFGDALGGNSQMMRLGWRASSNDYWQVILRRLRNDSRWVPFGITPVSYETMHEAQLSYFTKWKGHEIDSDLSVGRDVFGKSFIRLSGAVDLVQSMPRNRRTGVDIDTESDSVSLFIDAGVHRTTLTKIFFSRELHQALPAESGVHVGLGARRSVSEHSDLGVRAELDRVDGSSLLSLRLLDYRYRFSSHIAVNGFFGVGRYQLELPAHGYYMGAGAQYMNVMPGWDMSLDYRHYEKMGRDKVLVNDPPIIFNTPRLYLDANGVSLYATRHF